MLDKHGQQYSYVTSAIMNIVVSLLMCIAAVGEQILISNR